MPKGEAPSKGSNHTEDLETSSRTCWRQWKCINQRYLPDNHWPCGAKGSHKAVIARLERGLLERKGARNAPSSRNRKIPARRQLISLTSQWIAGLLFR